MNNLTTLPLYSAPVVTRALLQCSMHEICSIANLLLRPLQIFFWFSVTGWPKGHEHIFYIQTINFGPTISQVEYL